MSALLSTSAGMQFLVGGLGCGILSLWLLYLAARTRSRARRSLKWPHAPAVITHSEKIFFNRTPKNVSARIEYTYEVAGTAYKADRVRFLNISGTNESAVDATLERYPLGAKVTAFYSSEDPSYAVLERELTWSEQGFLLFCGFALAIGSAVNISVTWDRVAAAF